MALSTYAELQASIASFLARSDLTTQIPDFIALAEARMSRELDTRSQVKRATTSTTASDEFTSLPTDLRRISSVKLNTNPTKVLEYAPPHSYYSTYSDGSGGKPAYYTIVGAEIGLRPIPDSVMTVEIIYSDDVSSLSDSNTTNTILARHPDAYLYGSLAAAHAFLMDEQRASQYDGLFTRIINEIRVDTQSAKYPSSLTMKTEYAGV